MTPWALCMAPDGRHVYVSSPQGGRVLVVDTHTHRVTDSLACQSPGEMTVTPDGGRIHVAIASGVSVIDTGTEAVTAPSPSANVPGIALDPVRERLNASTSVGGFISVIDTDSDTGIRRIPTNGHPFALAVSADGSRLYASDRLVSAVMVIATDSGSVGAPIPVDSDPVTLLVTPDGRRIVADRLPEQDRHRHRRPDPHRRRCHPGRSLPHGPGRVPGRATPVRVPDLLSFDTRVVSAPVSSRPEAVAAHPDGRRVYVTASGDDKVAVVGPRERRMGVPSTVRVAVSTTCTFPVPESVT